MRSTGIYACVRKDRLTARTGTPYLALELRDRSGELAARVFRDADLQSARFERGDLVRASGRVVSFRGELQAELAGIARAPRRRGRPGSVPAVAYRDVEELDGFLEHLAGEVREPGYRALLSESSATSALRAALRRYPARASHHAYLGGLLEHTVAVATLAVEACALHPRLDQDLLLTAALLHDLGRTRELTLGAEIGLSDEGRLLGHVELGLRIVDERGARPASTSRAAWRSRTASSPTTARTPRRSGASRCPRRSPCTASTRSTRRSRERSSTGSGSTSRAPARDAA